MKKLIVFTTFFLFLSLYAQSYSGGTGTVADPFQIANKADLKYLSENVSEWNYHFIQTSNIIFNSTDYVSGGDFYNDLDYFRPIGNEFVTFNGSYNGQNYSIDSLRINTDFNDFVGFFGWTETATISNLHLTNVNIIGETNCGALVGLANNFSTITNCSSSGNVSAANGSVGGLVGRVQEGSITNSSSSCNVTTVFGGAGGLAGTSNLSTITNSFSSGTVTGDVFISVAVGGLIGSINSSNTISKCYSSGNVSANNKVGGFTGENVYSDISDCYSTGTVNGVDRIGGFAGFNEAGTFTNCYAVGNTTGSTNTGGFIGEIYLGTYNHIFWDTVSTTQSTSAAGNARNTLQMQTQSTFTDSTWDFVGEVANGTNDIWKMGECTNNAYPVLSYQTNTTFPDLTTSLSGVMITANATSVGYQWIDCATNTNISGETNANFTATANGDYAVIISKSGCMVDTSACVSIATVGLETNGEQSLAVFPSPTNGDFTIDLGGEVEQLTMLVRNELGQVVFQKRYNNVSQIQEFLMSPPGMYFIELNNSGKKSQLKLIKQ